MDAITYSHARSNLAQTMEKVCDDHAPIIITRKNQRSVVLLSLEDYRALEETAYLLRSPKNARRLLESVLSESDLVRRGVFVRPPIESWVSSWRALGFDGLSFRAANSRYQPGIASPDWVSAPMPRR